MIEPTVAEGQIWQALLLAGRGHERLVHVDVVHMSWAVIRTVLPQDGKWIQKPKSRRLSSAKISRFDGSYWGYRYVCDATYTGPFDIHGDGLVTKPDDRARFAAWSMREAAE